ncbi:type II toxin-antitoxin system VapC family toxin [Thermococcus celer]|uniref:DNA-binding protein n=1 Tax=Thermococcus celer Vu 13 = JCM 8558 TaxID=1293037 RepID=A0A218P0D2_THECE|nr:type II toxin-antitoxin system VapC family toxin [Thermococcus celer]ASI98388.1 DNA-binding protein [Thermococcus celer Vu 13 = JCM 8558]
MRFIDANVFIYAVLKPKRELNEKELEIKRVSKEIFNRINEGEEVITTVAHLSEVANVLEDAANLSFAVSFLKDVLIKGNVIVEEVSDKDYMESVLLAEEKGVSINDALAYILMKRRGIEEIYTFDRHFENLDVRIVNSVKDLIFNREEEKYTKRDHL